MKYILLVMGPSHPLSTQIDIDVIHMINNPGPSPSVLCVLLNYLVYRSLGLLSHRRSLMNNYGVTHHHASLS